MDAAGGFDLGLLPGDTLTLRYGASSQTVLDAQDGFLRVSAAGTMPQAAGWRRPGLPDPSTTLPSEFALHANQPNPFSRQTTVRFALPTSEHVQLEVFDIMGRRVGTLADGTFEAGEHAVSWDGRDTHGARSPAGVYHVRIKASEFRAQRTMVLLGN